MECSKRRRAHRGDRAFPVAAARAWNALPASVRTSESYIAFRRQIKTLLLFSIFTAEGLRPQNDASVLSKSFCLLLLSYTPPESCQSSLLYRLLIVSLAFLCLLSHPDKLQKCMCRGSVLGSCARSTVVSASLQWLPVLCLHRSRSSRIRRF